MILDTVLLLIKIWFQILRSLPLYLQAQFHDNQEVIEKLNEAYYLFFSGAAKVLVGLALAYAVPIIVVLVVLAVVLSVPTLVRLLGQLLLATAALFVGSSVFSVGVAVLMFLFRELKHATTTRTTSSSGGGDSGRSRRSGWSSTSRSTTRSKTRGAKTRDTSTRDDRATEPLGRVSVPTGDYHEVETDEYGQLKE